MVDWDLPGSWRYPGDSCKCRSGFLGHHSCQPCKAEPFTFPPGVVCWWVVVVVKIALLSRIILIVSAEQPWLDVCKMVWDFHPLFPLLLVKLEAWSVELDRSCHHGVTLLVSIYISATTAFAGKDGASVYTQLSLAKQNNEKMHLLHLGFHLDTERWCCSSFSLALAFSFTGLVFFLSMQNPLHLTFSKAFCVLW